MNKLAIVTFTLLTLTACNNDTPKTTDKSPSDGSMVACTQDVKMCPDGTGVGRDSENNCQFKPCPGQ